MAWPGHMQGVKGVGKERETPQRPPASEQREDTEGPGSLQPLPTAGTAAWKSLQGPCARPLPFGWHSKGCLPIAHPRALPN